MYKLTNKILKAINEAIQFSLDDFDEDDDMQIQNIKRRQKISDESTIIQKGIVNTQLTQKAFTYELLKRLPGVDGKLFTPFEFVNYKITGNYSDWPYLVSANKSMARRTLEKYQHIFDKPGWTTINGSGVFEGLLCILSDRYFKEYKNLLYDMNYPRGESAYKIFVEKDKWWLEAFKGKYNECHDALIKLAKANEFLNNESMIYINQISFSNDGAFFAIFFQWVDKKDYNYRYSINIFSTNKLVDDEKGINVDEYKVFKSNQTKFKNYLTKNIIKRFGNLEFSKLLVIDNINNHAAFVYETRNNFDFPWQSEPYRKAREAYELIRKCMPYNDVTYNLGTFMLFSILHNYYIEDNYHGTNIIYDNLIYKGRKPYAVVSNQSGEYLVAFYSNCKDYRNYSLTYAIIDNRDYKLMPKEFLKEIEYNEITL